MVPSTSTSCSGEPPIACLANAHHIGRVGTVVLLLALVAGGFGLYRLGYEQAPREADIQAYLRLWLADMPKARGSIRLSIDIDPYNFL